MYSSFRPCYKQTLMGSPKWMTAAMLTVLIVSYGKPAHSLIIPGMKVSRTAVSVQKSPLKVGLFAVRQTTQNPEETSTIRFDEGLTQIVAEYLTKQANVEVVILEWPANQAFGGSLAQPIGFTQMLAKGRQAKVDAVIVASVTQFDIKKKGLNIPGLGSINDTSARAKIEGALIDVFHGQVIGELIGDGRETKRGYNGPGLGELGNINLNGGDFTNSLPGKATQKAVNLFVKQFQELSPKISGGATPPRENPPAGLSFSQVRYQFDVERGYDQWAEVEIQNRDTRPHRFVVFPGNTPQDIVVGFVGKGSVDEVYEIAPGDFKTVRFAATTPQAKETSYKFPIHLYDMDNAQGKEELPQQSHDTAEVLLNVRAAQFRVKVQQTAENPGTLAKSFTITNEGPEITDLSVHLSPELITRSVLRPALEGYRLAAGESITVTVEPSLSEAFQPLDGEIEVTGAGQLLKSPVRFALPNGRKVFTVKVGSSETNTSTTHYCTNQGGGSSPTNSSEKAEGSAPDTKADDDIKEEHERGIKDKPWYENVDPKALEALERMKDSGRFLIKVTSAYRSQKYQDHLHEVYESYMTVESLPDMFSHISQEIISEFKSHGLTYPKIVKRKGQAQKIEHAPAKKSKHTSGLAFDMRVLTKEGKPLSDEDVTYIRMEYGIKRGEVHNAKSHNYHWTYSPKNENAKPVSSLQSVVFFNRARTRQIALVERFYDDDDAFHADEKLDEICAEDEDPNYQLPKRPAAYLTARFSTAHSYSVHTPHDTLLFVNGVKVGEILDAIPEGTYTFPVNPLFLNYREGIDPGKPNIITSKVVGMNAGHRIIANEFKIIAPLSNSPKVVVAGSQQEAEKIVRALPNINHDVPDVGVFANHVGQLPKDLTPGQKLIVKLLVKNQGEKESSQITLQTYNHNPASNEKRKPKIPDGIPQALAMLADRKPANLGSIAKDITIAALKPGEEIEVPVEITFTPQTTRLYFVAKTTTPDFDPANNLMTLTIVSPDMKSPLMGTDYPDVSLAPILGRLIQMPQLTEIKSMLFNKLGGQLDKVPYLRDVLSNFIKL